MQFWLGTKICCLLTYISSAQFQLKNWNTPAWLDSATFQLSWTQLGKFQLELIRYHVTVHGELFSKLKIQFSHILRTPQIFKKIFQLTKNVKSNWEIFLKFLCHSQNIWTLSKYFVKKQECSSFFVYSSNRLNLAFSKTNSCFLKMVLQNNSIQNITLQTLMHTVGSKSFIIRMYLMYFQIHIFKIIFFILVNPWVEFQGTTLTKLKKLHLKNSIS